MYFWNVNKLVEDWKEDRVSRFDKEIYPFLSLPLIFFIFVPNSARMDLFIASEPFFNIFLNFILRLVILYWGINNCYIKNKKYAGNKDFGNRFASLSLPMLIKVSCYGMFIGDLLYALFIYKNPGWYNNAFLRNIPGLFKISYIAIFFLKLGKKFDMLNND